MTEISTDLRIGISAREFDLIKWCFCWLRWKGRFWVRGLRLNPAEISMGQGRKLFLALKIE